MPDTLKAQIYIRFRIQPNTLWFKHILASFFEHQISLYLFLWLLDDECTGTAVIGRERKKERKKGWKTIERKPNANNAKNARETTENMLCVFAEIKKKAFKYNVCSFCVDPVFVRMNKVYLIWFMCLVSDG